LIDSNIEFERKKMIRRMRKSKIESERKWMTQLRLMQQRKMIMIRK